MVIAGLAQKMEHVSLVDLHTGLIKGIDPQHIGRNTAGELEEGAAHTVPAIRAGQQAYPQQN